MAVEINKSVKEICVKQKTLRKIVKRLLDELQIKNADISINFVGDKKIKQLNKKYRGKDKITDVLSFSMIEGEDEKEGKDWGDIFLCVPQIKRQAKEYAVEPEEECLRMVLHGILHLAGFDHQTKKQAKEMFELQERILSEFL